MPTEDVTLPPADRCIHGNRGWQCGRAAADHALALSEGGPGHTFTAPQGEPRPEHVVSCHIQTDWTCSHCGENNDVWGLAADEWMECASCGGQSFLLPFAADPPLQARKSMSEPPRIVSSRG